MYSFIEVEIQEKARFLEGTKIEQMRQCRIEEHFMKNSVKQLATQSRWLCARPLVCIALVAVIGFSFAALSLTGCDTGGGNTHTHEWQWVETTTPTITTDGVETETCSTCGETRGTRTGTAAFATPFFGTWKKDNIKLTINSSSLKQEDTTSVTIFENVVWTVAVNANDETKDEYPSGYTLDGTIVGEPRTMSLFINATKDKLSFRGSKSDIWTKL